MKSQTIVQKHNSNPSKIMPREAEKIDFEIIHHLPNQLGECPVWDDRENLIYWVDIKAQQILRHDPSSEKRILPICREGPECSRFAKTEGW